MNKQTIILASDHAGFELKEAIKKFLHEKGYAIDDIGAHVFDAEDECASGMAGVEPVEEGGARAADVQIAGW